MVTRLLSGNYPLGDVIWMYVDPSSLRNEMLQKYIQFMLAGSNLSSNRKELVAFGELTTFLQKK